MGTVWCQQTSVIIIQTEALKWPSVYAVDALLLFISPSYCLFSSGLAGLKSSEQCFYFLNFVIAVISFYHLCI